MEGEGPAVDAGVQLLGKSAGKGVGAVVYNDLPHLVLTCPQAIDLPRENDLIIWRSGCINWGLWLVVPS